MVGDKVNLGMDSPAVRGRARVQLFDAATGDLVRDEAHDNFVSPRFLRAIAQFANHGVFANEGLDNNAHSVVRSSNAFGMTPITGIALTDYDGAPDPEGEHFVRGRPLAHASIRYSGIGNNRGSYNGPESEHRFDYQKFVFDFTTNQANGTFQSIYSGFFDSSVVDAPYSAERASYTLSGYGASTRSSVPFSAMYRDFDSDNFYLFTEAAKVNRISGQDIWALAFGKQPKFAETITLPFTAYNGGKDAAIKGGRLYWVHSASSNDKRIYSAPLSDLSNARLEKSFNAAWASSRGITTSDISYMSGFTYNEVRDKFILGNPRDNAATGLGFAFLELDPVTFADGDAYGSKGATQFGWLNSFPGERGFVGRGTSWTDVGYFIDTADDGAIFYTQRFTKNPVAMMTSDIAYECTFHDAYGATYNLVPAQWFFSRALLDSPVTKTAQNTMKITYEFTFDPPSLA